MYYKEPLLDKDTKTSIMILLFAIAIVVSIAVLLFAVVIANMKINCSEYGELSKIETHSTLRNCYVKTNKGWLELDRYQLELVYNGNKQHGGNN